MRAWPIAVLWTLCVPLVVRVVRAEAYPDARAGAERHRYELQASLDPASHRVFGRARIHFVNHGARALDALYFHLYPNAFEHERTVFMREGGRSVRGRALSRPGGLEIRSLRTRAGGEPARDGLVGANFELVPHDRTQLRVPLEPALPPGHALEIEIEFVTRLPEIVARAGYAGAFHMLGQWYPKLARLSESGAFDSFPYHGLGEFYADFADYTLSLRVPSAQHIAAGGRRVASETHGGFRTETFVAERVHDLAAAVYPYFERQERRAAGVDIALYAPRGYGAAARRQLELTASGLRYFSAAYGPYPYAQLTVVIPPRMAAGAAGMEYPTLFLSDGTWSALPAGWPDPRHDVVVAHELAHQWFSSMIASNEVALPMLDEGLAQWTSLDFLRAHYPRLPRALDPFLLQAATFLFRGHPVPSSLLPAHAYKSDQLARAVYLRPSVVLADLERRSGRARLQRALGDYARAQRFRHPTLDDFFSAFDREYGPGFSARELEPALRGDHDLEPAGPAKPSALGLLPDLLAAAQLLLGALGP